MTIARSGMNKDGPEMHGHDDGEVSDSSAVIFGRQISLVGLRGGGEPYGGDDDDFNHDGSDGHKSSFKTTNTSVASSSFTPNLFEGEEQPHHGMSESQQESLTSSFRSNGSLESTFSNIFDEVIENGSKGHGHQQPTQATQVLTSSFRSNGSLESNLSNIFDEVENRDDGAPTKQVNPSQNTTQALTLSLRSNGSLESTLSNIFDEDTNQDHNIALLSNGAPGDEQLLGSGESLSNMEIAQHFQDDPHILRMPGNGQNLDDAFTKLLESMDVPIQLESQNQSKDSLEHEPEEQKEATAPTLEKESSRRNLQIAQLFADDPNVVMKRQTADAGDSNKAPDCNQDDPLDDVEVGDLPLKGGSQNSSTASLDKLFENDTAPEKKNDDSFDKLFGKPNSQPACERESYLDELMMGEPKPPEEEADDNKSNNSSFSRIFLEDEDALLEPALTMEGQRLAESCMSTVEETQISTGGPRSFGNPAFESGPTSPPTLHSEVHQARKEGPTPVDKTLRMSQQISDDETNPNRSDTSSPESEDDGYKVETSKVAAPRKVGGSKYKTQQTTTDRSYTQVFTDILQGFLKGDHYRDDDDDDNIIVPDASAFPPSVSPDPIAPHVELRHKRAKHNTTPRASNTTIGFATGPSPDLSSTSETSPSSSPVSSSVESIPNNEAAVPKPISESTPATGARFSSQTQGGTIQDSTPKAAVSQQSKKPSPKEPKEKSSRGTKRKEQEDQTPSNSNETTQIVGMGFFSQLQSFNTVVGTTEKKKRKRAQRKRKPKKDLLEGVSMGFFSSQMAEQQPSDSAKAKPQELSERIKPVYDWAPALDERTRAAMEFSLPLVLPAVAMASNYSSFAWIYCFALPFVHTLETLLTNFGPKASHLHFKFAPINPMWHMCIDLMLLHPMCILAFMCPEAYGKYAYVHGTILFFLEYIYWAIAYKDIVVRREAARVKMKAI